MAFKLASLAVALCVLATVLAAPSPKTVINAADNDVAVPKSVVDASAGAESSAIEPIRPSHGHATSRPGLFDDIFNIPTSILNAVSRLLNGGGKHTTTSGAGADAPLQTRIGGSDSGISSGTGSHVGNDHVKTGTGAGGGLISDIFNIPISALNAVNQLLNNNQKTSGK